MLLLKIILWYFDNNMTHYQRKKKFLLLHLFVFVVFSFKEQLFQFCTFVVFYLKEQLFQFCIFTEIPGHYILHSFVLILNHEKMAVNEAIFVI